MERLDVSGIVKMLRQIPRLRNSGEYAQFFYRGIQPTVFGQVVGDTLDLRRRWPLCPRDLKHSDRWVRITYVVGSV